MKWYFIIGSVFILFQALGAEWRDLYEGCVDESDVRNTTITIAVGLIIGIAFWPAILVNKMRRLAGK